MMVLSFRTVLQTLLLAVMLLTTGAAQASSTACPQHFLNGQAPVLTNPKLAAKTRELCYSGYAVLHSGVTRTPLWSAEHLTRERIEGARETARVNTFHPDPNLPESERAVLSDYARSGFDRGHMAPSGDMPDPQSQDESFSLANMIPQNPDNNRHLWEAIERAVRDLTMRDGEVYVVTGPIFSGENLQSLKGRVLVPTQIFKAVYDPKRHGAAAYVVQNAEGNDSRVISIAELQQLAGIDPFPALPQAAKPNAIELPKPRQRRPRRNEGPSAQAPSQPGRQPGPDDDFVGGMLEEIDRIGRP
jgi:endonuclease G, mitochondrial